MRSVRDSLYAARWRGQPGRLEVWYATLTDPATGSGLWLHHETVASTDGSAHRHGWVSVFPPAATPVTVRFGPVATRPSSSAACFSTGEVEAAPTRLAGEVGDHHWDLRVRDDAAPLYTFPRWAWERELLPAAQIVPAPQAKFSGEVRVGEHRLVLDEAPGAVARIYGHGNAEHWAWLHAGLGGGDALEIVAAVSRRPGMRRLRPLPFVQLRWNGRDWPRTPLLAAPLFRAHLDLPEWTVSGVVGRRRLRVAVRQEPADCVELTYHDPDGATATCTNSEVASAEIVLERWSGRWRPEARWTLDRTAHAEVGTRP